MDDTAPLMVSMSDHFRFFFLFRMSTRDLRALEQDAAVSCCFTGFFPGGRRGGKEGGGGVSTNIVVGECRLSHSTVTLFRTKLGFSAVPFGSITVETLRKREQTLFKPYNTFRGTICRASR